jgi:adenylylsulfate kinase
VEKQSNLVEYCSPVSRTDREILNKHRSINLWFTGLSGSGKSTLAHAVEEQLHRDGCRTYVFDGDNVRNGLCADLGFSPAERRENLRRISEMVRLFLDAGIISLTAFISPLAADRALVKQIIGRENMVEIFCNTPLEVCEQRDVKGFYARARRGEILNYTGISSPYEVPMDADIEIDTSRSSVQESVALIVAFLRGRSVLR